MGWGEFSCGPSVGHDASWAQIVTPLIAAAAVVMPEIGDEVLVAFEHGCAQRPYVLGTLWNGRGGRSGA
jgi:uncharacterized protein involved in type VI secretion and phage assembly